MSRDSEDSEQGTAPRNDDKWWIPTVKVPPEGLSEAMRRWMLSQKDSVNQVLKAAMAINAQVLSEMVVPENYIESLPKVLNIHHFLQEKGENYYLISVYYEITY